MSKSVSSSKQTTHIKTAKIRIRNKNGRFWNGGVFKWIENKIKQEVREEDSNLSLITTGREVTRRANDNIEEENQVGNTEVNVSEVQAQSNNEDDPALDEYRRGSMFSKQSFCGSKNTDLYSTLTSKGNKKKKSRSFK